MTDTEREAMDDLAHILRSVRTFRGLGVRALARKAGIAPSAVTEIEQGKRVMGFVVMLKLIHALRMNSSAQARFIANAKIASEQVREVWPLMEELLRQPNQTCVS